VELDALEHGALEAFDLLGGCSNGEADDLLVLLEEVELLGVTVDEVINLSMMMRSPFSDSNIKSSW